MFATHYHLLTDELKTNPQIANYNMACVVDEHQVSQTAHLSHTHTHTDRQTDRQTHTHTPTHEHVQTVLPPRLTSAIAAWRPLCALCVFCENRRM